MNTITKQLVKKEFNLDLYSDIYYHIEEMVLIFDSAFYSSYSIGIEGGRYSTFHHESLKAEIESMNNGFSTEEKYEYTEDDFASLSLTDYGLNMLQIKRVVFLELINEAILESCISSQEFDNICTNKEILIYN